MLARRDVKWRITTCMASDTLSTLETPQMHIISTCNL